MRGRDRKRLTKDHTCIYAQPMDTDHSIKKAGVEQGLGGRGLKGKKMRDIYNTVNDQIK